MSTISDTASETTLQLYTNPLNIQQKQLQMFEEHVFDGKQVLDGNNVFTFGLQMDATMTAGIVNQMVNGFKSLYPARASTMMDLYKHLSDYDYVGLFSKPATTKIQLMFDRNFLIDNAPKYGDTEYYKIVLPEYSKFTIGDYNFGIYYPISIVIKKAYYSNGSVDYDNTIFQCTWQWNEQTINPLCKLTTNIIDHRITKYEGISLFCMEIPIYQFETTTYTADTISSTGFLKRFPYSDRFYAIRIFHYNTYTSKWVQMSQTLSDTIYDVSNPTANIKVLSDIHFVQVSIPQAYFTYGTIGTKIKAIIYTTKGQLDIDLSGYTADKYAASFLLDDEAEYAEYAAFLKRSPLVYVLPMVKRISNGSNGKTFNQIKQRVMNQVTGDNTIITAKQLEAQISDQGFLVTKYVDNITDRTFLARRTITDTNGQIVPSGLYNIYLNYSILSNADGLYDTIKSVTANEYMIMPSTIFKYVDSLDAVIPLSLLERRAINNLSNSDLVAQLNNGGYTFTPFHIKVSTDDAFPMAGVYDLMNPSISGVTFVGQNNAVVTQVAMYSCAISHLGDGNNGYRFIVTLYKSNDLKTIVPTIFQDEKMKQNIVVMLRTRCSSGAMIYMKGSYIGQDESKNSVMQFDFTTQYKITSESKIDVDSFAVVSSTGKTEPSQQYIDLNSEFEILFFVNKQYIDDPSNLATLNTTAQNFIPKEIIDAGHIWLCTQRMDIKLGESIPALMPKMSINVSKESYKTYKSTQYASYNVDIYERYAENVYDETGKIIHYKGDLYLDENNNLIIKSHVGDLIKSNVEGSTSLVLRNPAFNFTKYEDKKTIDNLLYMSDEKTSPVPIQSVKWNSFYTYRTSLNGKYNHLYKLSCMDDAKRFKIVDLLKLMIDQIKQNNYIGNNPSILERQIEKITGESDQYKVIDYMPSNFAFISEDTTKVNPIYSIHLKEQGDTNKFVLDTQYGKTYNFQDVISDYDHIVFDDDNNVVYEDGKVKTKPITVPSNKFGSIYIKNTEKANFKYDDYVSLQELKTIYYLYDTGVSENKITEVIALIKEQYEITDEVLQSLLDFRNPWQKLVSIARLDVALQYWKNRELLGFTKNISINSKTGIPALTYIQSLLGSSSQIPNYKTIDIASTKVSVDTPIVWCEAYNPDDDTSLVQGSSTLTYDIQIPATGVKGALILYDYKNDGKHYRLVTGATLESCKAKVLSINTFSGLIYVCDTCGIDQTEELKLFENETYSSLKQLVNSTNSLVNYKKSEDTVYNKYKQYFSRSYSEIDKCYFYLKIDNPSGEITEDVYEYAQNIYFNFLKCNNLTYKNAYDITVTKYIIGIDVNTCLYDADAFWPWQSDNWCDASGISFQNLDIMLSINTIDNEANILHKQGQVMIDANGKAISDTNISGMRQYIYRINSIQCDYKLCYSSETKYASYKNDVRELLRNYFTTIDTERLKLLERTNLYFAPIKTIGSGEFRALDGNSQTIPLQISMNLRLHVKNDTSTSITDKQVIEANVQSIIEQQLATGTINCSIIANKIVSQMSDTVYYVDVLGINGESDLQTLISVDATSYIPRLRTNLVIDSDGAIKTKKDLTISYGIIN